MILCGIVGIVDLENNIISKKINVMAKTLVNKRSTDITITNPIKGVCFGMTSSREPIYNENKTLVLYFDGEIYNYNELTNILKNKGHIFDTTDKAEVVIHLYEEFGESSLKYLDGMFSLCILNTTTKSIFIARDRYGVKPMYYSYCDACFYLASNLKSIINAKSKNMINKEAIELYVNLRFIPAPYTIIKDINKLKAGESLSFENGVVKVKKYIKYNENYETPKNIDISKVIKENILTTCDDNDNLGTFLSGGLDSAIITSVIKNKHTNLKTFSIGYEVETDNDETEVAKKIAQELNVNNLCGKVQNDEVLDLLNKTIYYLDEPLYSTVSIATLKLSEISGLFVKNILTGDGSDEIFFGYKYLQDSLKQSNVEKSYIKSISWLKDTKYEELVLNPTLSEVEIKRILFEDCKMNNYAETFRRIELYKRLADYHLPRVGRLTASLDLQVKLPFLRNNIVEMALAINSDEMLNDIEPKKLLKTSMQSYLSPTIKNARKKPFTSPVKQWIENALNSDIKRIFNDKKLVELCGLNPIVLNNLLQKYNGTYSDVSEIWGIYMLLKWVEQNIKYIC